MNSSALAARFVSGPHITASSNAEHRLGDWLAELEPPQAAEIGAWLDRPPARAILLGIAEFSPYLFDLIRADATRLLRLLACDPEQHLTSLIENTSRDAVSIREARCVSGSQRNSRISRAASARTRSNR